ncbi:MAG TPA: CBS domain-containing protein [Longimicrobiales bacterium]
MTPNPVCCGPLDTVVRAAAIMDGLHCGCVPVVDPCTRRILGMLTDRDLALRVVAQGLAPAHVRVETVMSRGIICGRPDDDIEEIGERMRTHRVRRIPIVDADGRVVGIIAQADLAVRAMRERYAADAEEVARTLETISLPTLPERL